MVLTPAIMRLRTWTAAPLAPHPGRFEMLREVTAVAAPPAPCGTRTRTLFAAARLQCQRGGEVIAGEQCLACERIVSLRPARNHRTVTVRCLWTEDDPVADMMTLAASAVRVAPGATIAEAQGIALTEDAPQLLVVDGDEVVGTICACALGASRIGEPVAARMTARVWTLPPTATLGQAIAAFEALPIGVLVVADGAEVLGLVTPEDLGFDAHDHARAEAAPATPAAPP